MGWCRVLAELERLTLAELQDQEARDDLLTFYRIFRPSFDIGWIQREFAAELQLFTEEVEAKRSPRMEWNQPPQTGKSDLFSRLWPPWTLGRNPTWHWLTGCYGQDFANGFGRDVRDIMMSQRYAAIFPRARLGRMGRGKGSEAVNALTLSAGGSYHALSVGGKGTGMPATIFAIDDPVKGREEAESEAFQEESIHWYTQTCQTRLAPGGGIGLTMTRWDIKDMSGRIQTAEKLIDPLLRRNWRRHTYPALAIEDERHRKRGEAIHPERHSQREWEQRRAEMVALGQEREWLAVYQQRPTNEQGTFFRREWLRTYKVGEEPRCANYMGSDFAIGSKASAHYSAFPVAGWSADGHLYVRPGLYRAKGLSGPVQVKALLELYQAHDIQALAWDDTMIGKTLAGFIEEAADKARVMLNTWSFVASKDKQTHAMQLRALAAAGRLHFPEGAEFTDIWLPSLLSFGASTDDGDWDEIDGLAWLANMLRELIGPAEEKQPADPVRAAEKTRKAEIMSRRRPAPNDTRAAVTALFGERRRK